MDASEDRPASPYGYRYVYRYEYAYSYVYSMSEPSTTPLPLQPGSRLLTGRLRSGPIPRFHESDFDEGPPREGRGRWRGRRDRRGGRDPRGRR